MVGGLLTHLNDEEDMDRPLENDILTNLIEGRRTASELTSMIYGVTRSNPNYHTYYMRVSRAASELQKRGYVSKRIFGRDKPYKLTPYAAARMMDIGDEEEKILPLSDAVIYLATVGLGITNYLIASSDTWLKTPPTIAAYSIFLLLVGYCSSRLANATRKVT